ncbi:MAG: cell division protein FtsA [Neisseriaceae bacterium]
MSNNMIFSLDIGGSKVVAIVGSVCEQVEIQVISTYYFANNANGNDFSSVSGGVICDLEFISGVVNQTLNEARVEADCSIGSVITNISGSKVCNSYSVDKMELNNQAVTAITIQNLIDNARHMKIPDSFELLDYEVQEYLLDDERYAINPIHLSARTIESNLNLFMASSAQISNLKKVLRYSGFSLSQIVPSGILSGMSVLNREEKELGCCLIDIGASTTDVAVYENGFIRYLCSFPVGGESITRDIANVLKISRNLAEDIKLNYGGCSYTSNTQRFSEGISITDHRGVTISISRKLLVDVITERVKEIFAFTKSALNKQKIYDIISSGVVLTGGVSLLPDIDDLARQYFGTPVRIGIPNYTGDFVDMVSNPKYATSLGALYFASEYMFNDLKKKAVGPMVNSRSVFGKIKQIFK